jgi:hypothetical protein
MAHVHPGADGGVVLHLEDGEAEVLSGFFDEMKRLLEADIPRSDAVIGRLFPPAYDDVDDNDAYDALIHEELHDAKLAALRQARDDLDSGSADEVVLSPESAEGWLRLLTDLRLAIGTRLEVDEEMMAAEPDPSDPDSMALYALHWLGWVQESILRAIDPTLANGGTDAD